MSASSTLSKFTLITPTQTERTNTMFKNTDPHISTLVLNDLKSKLPHAEEVITSTLTILATSPGTIDIEALPSLYKIVGTVSHDDENYATIELFPQTPGGTAYYIRTMEQIPPGATPDDLSEPLSFDIVYATKEQLNVSHLMYIENGTITPHGIEVDIQIIIEFVKFIQVIANQRGQWYKIAQQ
jgi:hypothetical protein